MSPLRFFWLVVGPTVRPLQVLGLLAAYLLGGVLGLALAIVGDVANAHRWSVEVRENESGGARGEFWTD